MSERPTVGARRAVVVGRVQGVGFRWFVRQEARRLGLAGWVRNLADGSVELMVAGEESAVRRLLDHVAVGPDAAHVTAVRDEVAQAVEPLPYPFTVLK
ncbi:MAG TPA: acylphosphatase [Gemmatimonadales bacterium]